MGIEIMMETSTRSARNRRVVAILGWMVLVSTAIILWNGRIQGTIRTIDNELTACFLAAFAAFVGVFAWLLFNPGRRAASESPVLFSAAAATLFPPPIIGFCLMPIESPARAWLVAFGVFFLCVIAVLSHVPDDFFGVPRGRSSYMTPIPTFDSVDDSIMNPDAAWFTFEDLTRILPDTERPSLAPRSYLHQETGRLPTAQVRSQDKVASEVDDILGSDFDLGLLDEDITDFDRPTPQQPSSSRPGSSQRETTQSRREDPSLRNDRSLQDQQEDSRQTAGISQGVADTTVFESFERSSRRPQSEQSARYVAASASQKNLSGPKTRFRSASKAAAGTAKSVRTQLEFKNRHSTSGQTGSGLSSSVRKSFLQPLTSSSDAPPASRSSAGSTGPRRDQESEDFNIDYGTLDVHRGQQPTRATDEESRSKSTGTSRRQDRLQEERLKQERRQREREAVEQKSTEDLRTEVDTESRSRSGERSTSSTRNQRLSRYEQRQQAARDSQKAVESESSDRKLTRQGTGRASSEDSAVEAEPKRRSALDIATAGILGAGVASQVSSTETKDDSDTSDLDSVASQGLFGTVRDLFSKPKKASSEETSGAEDIEAAVESVQAPEKSNRDVSIERTIDASGAEMVEGVAVVRFERGQKKANVHIPFSPPMKGSPEVEVECVGDEQLRLKVPMAQPYGMRIEARRSNTSESLEAEIGFAAMAEEE